MYLSRLFSLGIFLFFSGHLIASNLAEDTPLYYHQLILEKIDLIITSKKNKEYEVAKLKAEINYLFDHKTKLLSNDEKWNIFEDFAQRLHRLDRLGYLEKMGKNLLLPFTEEKIEKPKRLYHYFWLVGIYQSNKKTKEAIGLLDQIESFLLAWPDPVLGIFQQIRFQIPLKKASIYANEGHYHLAIKTLESSLSYFSWSKSQITNHFLSPDNDETKLIDFTLKHHDRELSYIKQELSYLYYKIDNFKKATKILDEVKSDINTIHPHNRRTQLYYGLIAKKQGLIVKAYKRWKEYKSTEAYSHLPNKKLHKEFHER